MPDNPGTDLDQPVGAEFTNSIARASTSGLHSARGGKGRRNLRLYSPPAASTPRYARRGLAVHK